MRVDKIMVNGLEVVGYKLDNDGKELRVSKDDFMKLAESGKIEGVKVVDGCLTGLEFSRLEVENRHSLTVTGKEYTDDVVTGYKVIKEGESTERSISIQKTWDIAVIGGIKNATARMYTNDLGDVVKELVVNLVKP